MDARVGRQELMNLDRTTFATGLDAFCLPAAPWGR